MTERPTFLVSQRLLLFYQTPIYMKATEEIDYEGWNNLI